MTQFLRVVEASITEGGFEVHHYTGDDGYPKAAVFDVVFVTVADGRSFYIPRGVRRTDNEDGFVFYQDRYEATTMLNRVRARGTIDPNHWVEVEQREPMEKYFAPFGTAYQEEQRDNMGW